tara:strand:+ start:365 stop:499 length:135 start_codon:yes stop_codon:yes gene_type:complete
MGMGDLCSFGLCGGYKQEIPMGKKNALTQWKARFGLPEKNQIIC